MKTLIFIITVICIIFIVAISLLGRPQKYKPAPVVEIPKDTLQNWDCGEVECKG